MHDFIDDELGKVAPYGVYDLTANVGWVSVGIDHDTAEFAVQSIRRWWIEMGSPCTAKPSGCSWNKIEHRMFCHITNNWRGRPLPTRQVVVNLIGSVDHRTGFAGEGRAG